MIARVFRLFSVLVLALGIAMGAHSARAGDEGLYDPLPPEGSAFVRFIHADADADEATPSINGKAYDSVSFGGVKPYNVLKQGEGKISFGSANSTYAFQSGKYYSVILKDGKLAVVDEPINTNQLKAQVLIYNLTDKPELSLKTQDGKVSVAGPAAPGAHAEREINPVKVNFAVFSGEEKITDVPAMALERKQSYVVAVMNKGGEVKADIVKSELASK
jgi:alginate O-acetyltransferase complex protein AlgF